MTRAKPAGMGSLKIVTLNLWNEQGPWQRRLELVEAGVRALDADVVGLQEVRSLAGKVPNQAETLAGRLGMQLAYAVLTPWGGGEEGLAILSKHPIRATRRMVLPHSVPAETRILLSAAIETPVTRIGVHTTHLNYKMMDGDKRAGQVEAVDTLVRVWPESGDHPQVLMGDFNAAPDADEIRFLRGRTSMANRRTYWQDAWHSIHGDAGCITWAEANPYTEPLGWLERDRRLDYIFVGQERKGGRGRILDARMVLDQPVDGVFPSDHFGVYAEIAIGPAPEAK